MKAIFIDAEHRKIEAIEIGFSGRCGLGEFYETIGNGCRVVQTIPWEGKNDLVVDEEILLRGDVDYGFKCRNYNGMKIIGNGIVVGYGEEDFDDTTTTPEEVAKIIQFFSIIGG